MASLFILYPNRKMCFKTQTKIKSLDKKIHIYAKNMACLLLAQPLRCVDALRELCAKSNVKQDHFSVYAKVDFLSAWK